MERKREPFCCVIRHRRTTFSRCHSGNTIVRCMHASSSSITNSGKYIVDHGRILQYLPLFSVFIRIPISYFPCSFDCHDPGVYTSSTVTGLLEHYKDPACVMFFEPALTLPLNRNFPFSLQQLCRATIVSNTTYDGINSLTLPKQLKAYLKEYHYKQRVRVKKDD